ncbi:MAG: toll/interleukin-1 receptor domain-containing protein [Candidatus Competibacteraceae bacterium]
MNNVIFISYSHKDKNYRDELVPVLETVGSIRDRLWVDQKKLDIGDQFHPAIQQALAGTRVALLLISHHFLTSRYITQHELPYLLDQAERGALKLGMLYVSSIPEAALSVALERDGGPWTVNLAAILGVNSPAEPLDLMKDRGERNAIYARVADWVTRWLKPPSPPPQAPTGPRHELVILIQSRRDHWQHQFFLPTQPDAIKPKLTCPEPASVFGYDLDGETLFALLFGDDPQISGHLLALAAGADHPLDPTEAPLRIRLLTSDPRLHVLPWGSIAYRGRPLYRDGWTVELHAGGEPAFPEYVRHLCYFPGRVVLVGSAASRQAAHFHDLHHFFQRHWPDNPAPAVVAGAGDLRAALQAGSTRLVYYYGPASRQGLLLQDGAMNDGCVTWPELAAWLRQSQSVSVLFLNLVGDTGYEALTQGAVLLNGVKGAVLFQCHPRANTHAAAQAGLVWLDKVFCRRLDPVVALHQSPGGHINAWTRYSSWQTLAPARLQNPDLVNLLLDRHRQRDTLSGARDEFYTYATRYIHHVVALGTPGCLTSHFCPVSIIF